jgi:hypothetical protein
MVALALSLFAAGEEPTAPVANEPVKDVLATAETPKKAAKPALTTDEAPVATPDEGGECAGEMRTGAEVPATSWFAEHQYVAVWLAAAGTCGAAFLALWLGLKSGRESREALKIAAISTQLGMLRDAAQRQWNGSNTFFFCMRKQEFAEFPTDLNTLRRLLSSLPRWEKVLLRMPNQGESVRISAYLDSVYKINPHIKAMIACLEELERVTGIRTEEPRDDAFRGIARRLVEAIDKNLSSFEQTGKP